MDVTLLILRVTHITAGVFWAGGALVSAAFINPTAKFVKQDAAKFLAHLNFVRRYPLWLGIAGALNVLSGATLYNRLYGDRVLFAPNSALALTIGGILGVLALGMGLGMMLPAGNKLEALVKAVAAGDGPPSPEQAAAIGVIQEKLMRWTVMVTLLLLLAVIAMSANEAL